MALAAWRAVALAAVLTVAGCAEDDDPYAAISSAEMSYVIPDSAGWAPGNPCATADCGGPATPETLRQLDWAVLTGVTGEPGEFGEARTITVDPAFSDQLRGSPPDDRYRIWGQDAAWLAEVLEEGHTVWAGWGDIGYLEQLIAIDEDGRIAGIGYGSGRLTTTPLVRLAADGDWPSARAMLHALLLEE